MFIIRNIEHEIFIVILQLCRSDLPVHPLLKTGGCCTYYTHSHQSGNFPTLVLLQWPVMYFPVCCSGCTRESQTPGLNCPPRLHNEPSAQPSTPPQPCTCKSVTSCISRRFMGNVMPFPHADVTCENTESPPPGAWKCPFCGGKDITRNWNLRISKIRYFDLELHLVTCKFQLLCQCSNLLKLEQVHFGNELFVSNISARNIGCNFFVCVKLYIIRLLFISSAKHQF